MSEANKTLVQRCVDEVWNQKDLDRLDQFLAPSFTGQTPDGMLRNRNEYRQHVERYAKAFPDCRILIEQMVAEGDLVAVQYTASGTHRGDFKGIAPTAKHASVKGMMVLKISGGKIVNEISAWDRLSLFEQLGVTPDTREMSRKASR